MYEDVSRKIVLHFVKNGLIKNQDIDNYKYGFEILLSSVTTLVLLAFIAIISNKLKISLFYILGFVTTRICCGGYHAKKHFSCLIITIANYLFFLLPTYYVSKSTLKTVVFIMMFVSLVTIIKLSPINHIYNPQKGSQKKKFRIISVFWVCCYTFLCFTLLKKDLFIYEVYSVSFGIFVVSVSMIIVRFKSCLDRR